MEKEAEDESNICDGTGSADVVHLGRRLIPFISEEFGEFGTLQLSGDSYANLDTYTITESVSEHHAHPGA